MKRCESFHEVAQAILARDVEIGGVHRRNHGFAQADFGATPQTIRRRLERALPFDTTAALRRSARPPDDEPRGKGDVLPRAQINN